MKLVYATTNSGKLGELKKLFQAFQIDLYSPMDFGIHLDIAEDGRSLEENAAKKAEAYVQLLPKDTLIMGDDTGVFIAALNGEPGIHVRRWKGYTMTDQEIIDYCLSEMKDVPANKREAEMRTVIAIAGKGRPTVKFEGKLPGSIVEQPIPLKIQGFPFESLFLAEEYNMMLGKIHELPIENKIHLNLLTHRERAVMLALPYIQDILGI